MKRLLIAVLILGALAGCERASPASVVTDSGVRTSCNDVYVDPDDPEWVVCEQGDKVTKFREEHVVEVVEEEP